MKVFKRVVAAVVALSMVMPLFPAKALAKEAKLLNLALNKPATESSVYPGSGKDAAKAVDGIVSADSRWSTKRLGTGSPADQYDPSMEQWMMVDLEAEYGITQININWEGAFAKKYTVQGSLNGKEFFDVLTGAATDAGEQQLKDFDKFDARYVRVLCQEPKNPSWGYSIYELEVYSEDMADEGIPSTAAEVIEAVAGEAPTLSEDGKSLVLPEVPEGFEIKLYGTDNAQVVSTDNKVHQPLVDMPVNVLYQVINTNDETDAAESKTDVLLTVPGKYSAEAADNAKPNVVPGLREWKGAEGSFQLRGSSRIVYTEDSQRAAAEMIQSYFSDMLGLDVEAVKGEYQAGDVVLKNEYTEEELGAEGYYMSIADAVVISAPTKQGLIYGGASITQILSQSDDLTAPKGITRDYPQYPVRAGMIDVGRMYIPLEYLEEITIYMSYYKMNEAHIHINDYWGASGYSAFRLESEVYPMIVAEDGYYTKEDYRQYQKDMKAYGIDVITEIDTPYHAEAFRNIPGVVMWPGQAGRLDIRTEDAFNANCAIIEKLFDEYLDGEDPVFQSGNFHIGTDEYDKSASEQMRKWTDHFAKYVNAKGYQSRAWASLGKNGFNGTTPVTNDIVMNLWAPYWADVHETYDAGYDVINTYGGWLYIVPAANAGYPDRYDVKRLYEQFEVNNFKSGRNPSGEAIMPVAHPQTKGAEFALWNDMTSFRTGFSWFDIFDRLKDAVSLVSEKTWYGEDDNGQTYAEFRSRIDALQDKAPNTNPGRFVKSADELIAKYEFDENGTAVKDAGKNGYDAALVNAQAADGEVKFDGTGYLSLPMDSIGYPYTVLMNFKLDEVNEEVTLFDGAEGRFYVNKDGKFEYARDQYSFTFEYRPEAGKNIALALACDNKNLTLYANGKKVGTGKLTNATLAGKTQQSSTFVLPVEKVFAGTKGTLKNFSVYNTVLSAEEIFELLGYEQENLALNKPVTVSGLEVDDGRFTAEMAVDGKADTRVSFAKDKDEQWLLVDLGEVKKVSDFVLNFESTVGKYEIQVSEDGQNFETVYTKNEDTVKNNGGVAAVETIKIEQTDARYVKYVQKERWNHLGNGKWYSGSIYEFEVYAPLEVIVGPSRNALVALGPNSSGSLSAQREIGPSETKQVTVEFDMYTSLEPTQTNTAVGLGSAGSNYTAYGQVPVIVRMYKDGFFGAYNKAAGNYVQSNVKFTKNEKYHVRVVIDLEAENYDAYVTGPDGKEVPFAENFTYRAAAPENIGKVYLFNNEQPEGSYWLEKITVADNEPEEETTYIIDDVDERFAYSAGDANHGGWESWSDGSGKPEVTEHWSNTAGATLDITFEGTKLELYGKKDPSHAMFSVQIDDGKTVECDAYAAVKDTQAKLYESEKLASGEHVAHITVLGKRNPNSTGTGSVYGVQFVYAKVTGKAEEPEKPAFPGYTDIDDAVLTTTGEAFKIQYTPASAWHAEAGYPNLFLNGTDHYSDKNMTDVYWTVDFEGTGVDIYGSKNTAHADAEVYIDGKLAGEMKSRLASGATQHQQLLFSEKELENGKHTLKVQIKAGETGAMQVDMVRVYHEEIAATAITLNQTEVRLGTGEKAELAVTGVEPWFAAAPEIVWTSADASVAKVDKNGVVTALAETKAETTITAAVKGTDVSASVKVVVDPMIQKLNVTISNEKLLDIQEDYSRLLAAETVTETAKTAWRGDTLNSKITAVAKDQDIHNVEIKASDFRNEAGNVLSADNVEIKWLKEIKANDGRNQGGVVKAYPDVIYKGGKADIAAKTVKFAWVNIDVPENTKPGTYKGVLTVTAEELKLPVELEYTVEVLDLVQPAAEATELQIWQHPFSVANYYLGLGSKPSGGITYDSADDFYFTEEHFNLMRAMIEDYVSIGGHDAVANIVEEAWNHQSYYGDPSMVKWTLKADGTWEFDYTWYDKWINFMVECGVLDPEAGIGQIKCYSIVPWNNQIAYYDEAQGKTVKVSRTPGTDAWKKMWTPFLEDFMAHSKEMGWFELTYISMDERGLDQLRPAVDMIESVQDENGNHFKISSALNYAAPEYYDFTDRIDDISINLGNTKNVVQMNELSDHRRGLGLTTTYYTCTGDYPSNFTISDPGDNYWDLWYTMTLGTDGYMRWAWDNFVYDMHGNVTYRYWEPGDGWFIYPEEREAADMSATVPFYSTPRYELFKQGMRDVAKAKYLMAQSEELNAEISELLDGMQRPNAGKHNQSAVAATEADRMLVHSETDRVYAKVTELAREYAETAVKTYHVVAEGYLDGWYEYNTKLTVKAEPEKDGKTFAGWEVNGKIVSTKETYTFFVGTDLTLNAVYEEVEIPAAAILQDVAAAKRTDGKSDIRYLAQLVLPEGYKLKQAGLVWSSNEITELALGGDAKVTNISTISNTWQFSVTIKGMPEGKFVRGKVFAVVTDAAGNETIVYSEEGRAGAQPVSITVGTFNIKANAKKVKNLAQLALDHGVELVGLQEVDKNTGRSGKTDMLKNFSEVGYPSYYFSKAINHDGGEYGIGTASKYALKESSTTQLENAGYEQRVYQRSVLEKDGRQIAFYNTHLEWEDMALRKRQMEALKAAIKADKTEYIVVTGDFNADQSRDEFNVFLDELDMVNGRDGVWYDTFTGVDPTMKVNSVDNILVSKNLKITDIRMVEAPDSDHNLLMAKLIFNK